jgi:hypothetical protein
MNKTNKRREEQLGMPYGTACNRLRKEILFHLVKKLNEDICYKCGKKIDTKEELTIEHKEPWLDVDVDLFWNLKNISFSHSKCNNTDRPWQKPLNIHGTSSMYNKSCKCFLCNKFNAYKSREYRKKIKQARLAE